VTGVERVTSRGRRWLVLIVGVSLVAVAATVYALPEVVRRVAVARLQGITHRPVRIDRVNLNLLTGWLSVSGFHLAERGGETAFADFERLDVHLHLGALLRGHLWIRSAVLRNSTVRVVRFLDGFNFSDLIRSAGPTSGPLDITVDRFSLVGGTVTLEDRALAEPRTWTSENIQIEARNVSTRRDDGSAMGTSVTAGAPTSVEIEHLRLYPIHLQATVEVKGLDLALAGLYLPPDAPVVLDRGRASTSVRVVLDAHAGLRADVTGQFEDVALVKPGARAPLVRVPKLTAEVTDFVFQDGRLELGRFDLAASASVHNPTATSAARFEVTTVRASVADLTWPVITPGRLDLRTSVPGGGTLALSGTLRPPPAASQLRLRLSTVDLAPWTRFLPISARVLGVADADLRIDEPLRPGVPTRIRGSMAVNRLGMRDARHELVGADRVEATGLEMHWPTRLAVTRLLVSGPRAMVERDRAGGFPLLRLGNGTPAVATATSAANGERVTRSTPSRLGVEIREIVVRDGTIKWRDESGASPVALDISRIEAQVTGAGWPLHGPLGVRVAARPPGSGQFQVAGRLALDPFAADLRLAVKDAELAPYQPYLPTPARISGRADLDLAMSFPASSEGGATVRGTAALSRVDVRDGQRTVMRIERAAATGLDVEWPKRAAALELALQRPWILIERDETGALALRSLLPSPTTSPRGSAANTGHDGRAIAFALERVVIDDGGVRVVDRANSPPFALDLHRLAARVEGLSTVSARPVRVDVTGRPGPGANLELHGTVGAIGGPLRLDMTADLRGFGIPRTNPYLLSEVGWEATGGWLATNLSCRIEGDALDAKTDIRLSRLELARGTHDEAQARIGLPLGLIVALMEDSRGDIHVSLPVDGRLRDPHFDFSEAIWSAVRNVAIKSITGPVSWIGRVQFSPDSRIERIEVNPIRFRPGTATFTRDGQEQVARVAEFLRQAPAARMGLTPVVSSEDVAALRRHALEADIERVTDEARISPDEAAARLYQERFRGRSLPDTAEAVRAALAEDEAISPAAVRGLAAQRMEMVRAVVKQAGLDPGRLPEKAPLVQGQGEGEVKLDVAEPESPRRPPPQRREFLGIPLPFGASSRP
jgi:hypothetical protein